MMNNQFGKDLTSGSILKNLIQFALPILIGNLLSTGYSIINTIWVGNLLGKDAVGAVAVSFPIYLAMIALCSGATLATSILISKAFGAKDYALIQKVVNNSWSVGILIIVTVTFGGLITAEAMLRLLATPTEIMPLATNYLRITMINFTGLYLSYLISSILRGIGDTVIPMIFIIISTVVNAVLDPVLIIGIGPIPTLGLNGAAIASLISTGCAVIPGIIYTKNKYNNGPINLSKLQFEKSTISEILKIGVTFPQVIMRIFVKEVDVVTVGIDYLRLVGAGYLFFIIFYVSNGIINGAGKTISTMVISFISLCVIRIPLAGLLSHTKLGVRGIWIAIVISFAVSTINSLVYYRWGKWRNCLFRENNVK